MISAYKLTSKEGTTFGGQEWRIGETVRAHGLRNKLCTDGLLHAYRDPLLAVLLNPIHAAFAEPRLFRVEGPKIVAEDGLKIGMKEQTPVVELDAPRPTELCIAFFAILCALEVSPGGCFTRWARDYITDANRRDYLVELGLNMARRLFPYSDDEQDCALTAIWAIECTGRRYVAPDHAGACLEERCAYYAASAAELAYNAFPDINLPRLADKAFHLAGDGFSAA